MLNFLSFVDEHELNNVVLHGSIAWVLGSEEKGLRRMTRETCNQLVRIPMLGTIESLNVSVSAGICLFETHRQQLLAQSMAATHVV